MKRISPPKGVQASPVATPGMVVRRLISSFSRKWGLPKYTLVATQGAAHHLEFEVECALPAKKLATRGRGGSKRAAEQEAAQLLWKALQ